MRRVSRFLVVLSLSFLPLASVEARERLVMPYDCDLAGGEPRLSPSTEKSYRIVGNRDEQTVTTCTDGPSAGCRTVMVHKFAISCGGTSVAWVRVAAAIRAAAANRAWMEDGRLNLVMPAQAGADAPASCYEAHAAVGASALGRKVVLARDCLPWRRRAAFDHLVLPIGFGPIGELGARLMFGGAAEEAAADDEGTGPARLVRVSMSDEEMAVAKADPDAVLQPAGRAETFETALEPDAASDEWITVVHTGADPEQAEPPADAPNSRPWALVLAIVSSAVIAVLLVMRAVPLWWGRPAPTSIRSLTKTDLSLANASLAVGALLQQTEDAARLLKAAGPLREVLQGELKRVRDRLITLESLGAKGELPAEKSAVQFRGMVRELERIRRIVDSAVASLSRSRQPTMLPRTASEAYDVLGVNAEVSANVLKKIVDALRMSWHPDHARDADDRQQREDRIRQINTAWELINGKREAA